MCLQIGNKVAVLDDVLKGKVIKINGEDISVEMEDGMVLLFLKSELIKIDREQHELTKFNDINHPLLQEKKAFNKPKESFFKKEKNEVILEVDLHIHHLTKTTRNLDNYDMLNIQLDTAKRKVEYAIEKRISKIVFIHGIGEGVLKSELLRMLKKYPVHFYDASYKKYGLGATEVYVYQNSK